MIAKARRALVGVTVQTPVLPLIQARWEGLLPAEAEVTLKLELFQQAGSFKARGAYLGLAGLSAAEREAGVVAASGGNHALAVAWSAQAAGVKALIAMPEATDPGRIARCRALGATVSLHPDMAAAFAAMQDAAAAGRSLLHPFEAPHMVLGAATCGAEFLDQAPDADAFVIPVGGGGLIAGMARAIKLARPRAMVIGVEPAGADSLARSFAAGAPATLDRVATIADSLGAPYALPLTYAIARDHVDRLVQISDAQMLAAMQLYQDNLSLMVEPACAAALAAVLGPLRGDLAGRQIAVIACGSNISARRYQALMAAL